MLPGYGEKATAERTYLQNSHERYEINLFTLERLETYSSLSNTILQTYDWDENPGHRSSVSG